MADEREFVFSLELSDQTSCDAMLLDLARTIFGHVGFAAAPADELAGALDQALRGAAAAGHRRCRIQFRAHAAVLDIAVSFDGGAEWRTSRPLP